MSESLLDALDDVCVAFDETEALVDWNRAATEVTGHTDAELASTTLGDLFGDAVARTDLPSAVRDSGGFTVETELSTADGTRRYYELKVSEVGGGDPAEFVGVARDITGRKASERRLRSGGGFVTGIFDSIPAPLYASDTERRLIGWNKRLATVTGYSDAELDGIDVIELVPEEQTDSVRASIRSVLSERRTVTIESALETADGGCIPYEFTSGPLEDGDGKLRGIAGIGRDLTAHKEHERRLTALNEVSHDLMAADTRTAVAEIGVNTARDVVGLETNAIHLYDPDRSGLVPIAATDAVSDLVGEPPILTEGESIAWRAYERGEVIAIDDISDDPNRHNPETPIRSELYFPIGEYGVLLAGSTTVEAFERRDVALGELLANSVATALEQLDRTERLRTSERELARQNERLEEFASVVSHDLRGPLSVASGRVELAQAEFDSEHLDAAADAHDRMRTLIDDLLALAREGEAASSTEPVDVGELAERCWRNVGTGGGKLDVAVGRTIEADRSRLQQLLENLIGNAVEHGSTSPDSGGDGSVTVTVGELDDGFYVADDGPGVPEATREEIFEAGYSTAEDGTGFGLSIVKQVVDAHGWSVRVTGSTDGGARFEITGVEFS